MGERETALQVGKEEKELGAGELKELVESLRESILELKATISDISGPFSKARGLSGVNDAEPDHEVNETITPISASPKLLPPPVTHSTVKIGSPDEGKDAVKPESSNGGDAESIRAGLPAREETSEKAHVKPHESKEDTGGTTASQRWSLSQVFKMMKILSALTRTFPEENVKSYLKLLRIFGFIDDETYKNIETMMEVIETSRRANASPEAQMIVFYTLARMLGLRDPALEEEATMTFLEKINNAGSG